MLHDQDIREPLFEYLEEVYGKIRIIEEKQMGNSRADVVMVAEEALFGIEIKSDADTYARLESQVKDYDKFYDYNIVVVGTTHAMHIEEHVPEWWGIITAEIEEDSLDFYYLRRPQPNPNMDLKKKVQILWRPEVAHILEKYRLPAYKEKSKQYAMRKLVEKMPDFILNREISQELFERDYTEIEEQIAAYRKEQSRKNVVRRSIIKRRRR